MTSPQPPAQPRKKRRLMDSSLRNIVWALGLTMAVVAVVAIAFYGAGSQHPWERERLPNAEVDVHASAERAAEVAPFDVVVPAVDEPEWTVRDARFTGGEKPQWKIQYTAPSGELVTVLQAAEVSAYEVAAVMPGATKIEDATVASAQCEVLTTGEADAHGEVGADETGRRGDSGDSQRSADGSAVSNALTCTTDDFGLVVFGNAPREEIHELTQKALQSVPPQRAAQGE